MKPERQSCCPSWKLGSISLGDNTSSKRENIVELFWSRWLLHEHTIYIDTGNPDDLSNAINPTISKYVASAQQFKALESVWLMHREFAYAKNSVIVCSNLLKSEPRQKKALKQHLGRIYDEEGRKHVFDRFVTSGGPMTTKEIEAMLASGSRVGKITDTECSVCGLRASEHKKLDEQKIRAALDTLSDIQNLHRFYQNRCPAGQLHNFSSGTCGKCGLAFGVIDINYYNKYLDTFHDQYQEERSQAQRVVSMSPTAPFDSTAIDYPQYHNYIFDFNKPLKFSAFVNANNNLLLALGSIENVEYADVLSGKFIPPEPDDILNQRLYLLDSMVTFVLTMYNKLRDYSRIVKPPTLLRMIVEESDVKKFQYSMLDKVLPTMYTDYKAQIKWFHKNKKPRVIVEFLIETFATIMLDIVAVGATARTDIKLEKLCNGFVKHITEHIYSADRNTTKYGAVNWKMFSKQKENEIDILMNPESTANDENYDTNLDVDADQISPDTVEQKETDEIDADGEGDAAEEEFESTDAPFQNNFDIDGNINDTDAIDEELQTLKLEDTGISGIE